MRKELENRLIGLSLAINRICKVLDKSFLSQHITTQIIRSSTSAALNYGEAQAAESRNDEHQAKMEKWSSRQGEFHPKPLTEPYVTVSRHTALVIQI